MTIVLYYQIKIPIGFLSRQDSISIFFIQRQETIKMPINHVGWKNRNPNSIVLLLLLLNLLLPIGFLDFVTSILFLLLLLKNWGKVLLLLWFNKSLGINIFRDIWCKIGIISHERDAVYYVTFINYYLFFIFYFFFFWDARATQWN